MDAKGNRRQRGALLIEALVGVALVGLLAAGGVGLVSLASRTAREAARRDEARAAAEAAAARATALSFAALPPLFGARAGDAAAAVDTADRTAPAGWGELVAALPEGRLQCSLEGVGAGGALAPFDDALALRLRFVATWKEGADVRAVELVAFHF